MTSKLKERQYPFRRVAIQLFLTCGAFQIGLAVKRNRPLEGQVINCCIVSGYPIVFPDESREPYSWNGIGIDYLFSLQEQLGFSCKDLPYLSPRNESFNGLVDAFEARSNGTYPPSLPVCQCELGVGSWMFTSQRFNRVDFVTPYLREELRVVVHVDNTISSIHWDYFLTTFSPAVWVLILGLFFSFALLKLLDRRFELPEHKYIPLDKSHSWFSRSRHYLLHSPVPYRIRKSLKSALIRLTSGTGDGTDCVSNSSRQWVLNFFLLLCAIFLTMTYNATMTASLVQETIKSDYNTIEDFKSCRILPSDVCLPRQGVAADLWRTSIFERQACIGEDGENENSFPRVFDTFEETVAAVAEKRCKYVVLDAETAGDVVTGKYCQEVIVTGAPLFLGEFSFIAPLNSNLTRVLGRETLRLREIGRVWTLESFYSQRGVCARPNFRTLNPEKLRLFFILAYAACGGMLVFMLIAPFVWSKPARPERQCDESGFNKWTGGDAGHDQGEVRTVRPIEVHLQSGVLLALHEEGGVVQCQGQQDGSLQGRTEPQGGAVTKLDRL